MATTLDRLSIGVSTQDELQSWLLSYLQKILDSHDEILIDVANELDADLLQPSTEIHHYPPLDTTRCVAVECGQWLHNRCPPPKSGF